MSLTPAGGLAFIVDVVLISTEGRKRNKSDQSQALAPLLFRIWQLHMAHIVRDVPS